MSKKEQKLHFEAGIAMAKGLSCSEMLALAKKYYKNADCAECKHDYYFNFYFAMGIEEAIYRENNNF